MKDSQNSPKKNNLPTSKSSWNSHLTLQQLRQIFKPKKNNLSNNTKTVKAHFFDLVIILLLLNVASIAVIIFYFQRIYHYTLPTSSHEYLKVTSIPLSESLDSINASAAAYVVYDTSSRSVVAGKNGNLRFSPASTAKVISALLIIDYYDLDKYLLVPDSIDLVQGSKMHLVKGEEIKVIDLLYGLMLPSGNDAAFVLAYHYKNGKEDFIADMNKKAQEFGLSNTYFLDPSGLGDGNFTTAEELARLGAFAMENKTFRDIVKTSEIEVNNKAGTHPFYLKNLNELLQYDNVLGIKTGFTNEAGGVLLTAIQKGDSLFVVSVLKSEDRFYDTKDLMSFIIEKVNFALPPN